MFIYWILLAIIVAHTLLSLGNESEQRVKRPSFKLLVLSCCALVLFGCASTNKKPDPTVQAIQSAQNAENEIKWQRDQAIQNAQIAANAKLIRGDEPFILERMSTNENEDRIARENCNLVWAKRKHWSKNSQKKFNENFQEAFYEALDEKYTNMDAVTVLGVCNQNADRCDNRFLESLARMSHNSGVENELKGRIAQINANANEAIAEARARTAAIDRFIGNEIMNSP